MLSADWLQDLGHGIHCIDTGYQRPGLAAAYLLVDAGEAAFVDTGTARSVPRLLEALARLEVPRGSVRWVCPTHVHLDHAGGAGALMQALPRARLVVHPRGARHLVDPRALEAGVRAVYGDAGFECLFGEIVPVPARCVLEAPDGMELALGSRILRFLDTPGHARHHYSIWDPASRGFFTGDSFGLAYPSIACVERPFVFPTTTPVQFDPQAWHTTLDRYVSAGPRRMYLTHFGVVADVESLAQDLRRRIDDVAALASTLPPEDRNIETLKARLERYLLGELRVCGSPERSAETILRAFAMDLELNAQGLLVWLERTRASA